MLILLFDPSKSIFILKGWKILMKIQELSSQIRPASRQAMEEAAKRCDSLVKPLRSLGRLESLAIRLAGITGKVQNRFESRAILVCCSDNGVVEEGVASAPQSVTFSQTLNFAKGVTGVCALAKTAGSEVIPVDVGVNGDISDPRIINRKIRYGTGNIAKGPAMSREEAVQAIVAGYEETATAICRGVRLMGFGEMGIGNTTTSAAVLSALTGLAPQRTAGRGAGLTDEGYRKKVTVIEEALSVNKPNAMDVLDVLSKVGGLDIAAMAGGYLAAAVHRIPAVVDGFISIVAALCAVRFCEPVKDYLIPSHCSKERGYAIAAKELGISPCIALDMGLGEGSGCPIGFSLIDYACAIMNDMATFEEASIDNGFLDAVKDANF